MQTSLPAGVAGIVAFIAMGSLNAVAAKEAGKVASMVDEIFRLLNGDFRAVTLISAPR